MAGIERLEKNDGVPGGPPLPRDLLKINGPLSPSNIRDLAGLIWQAKGSPLNQTQTQQDQDFIEAERLLGKAYAEGDPEALNQVLSIWQTGREGKKTPF